MFDYPAVIDFRPKFDFKFMVPNHGGDPLIFILGPMGSHRVPKMSRNRKNYHAPKFEFSTTPRSSISTKIRLYGYGTKSRWGPLRGHLGANGVLFGSQKWIKTVNNYHARNSNFQLHRSHRFRPKFEFRVMAPNQGWDPLGSILGPRGPIGSKKMGQIRKKLPCPRIQIFDYTAVIDFGQNSTLRLWRQITVGTP